MAGNGILKVVKMIELDNEGQLCLIREVNNCYAASTCAVAYRCFTMQIYNIKKALSRVWVKFFTLIF